MTQERLNYAGLKKGQPLPEILTEGEITLLIRSLASNKTYWSRKGYKDWGEFMRWRDMAFIFTTYLLGTRPKETCCIKFSDIDFRYNTIRISGSSNKCRKDRVIPLPKHLFQIFKNYLTFPKARFWRGSQYLFPSLQGWHISPSRMKSVFREKCLKPAGLFRLKVGSRIPKFRLYTLRHSRASHILNKQIKTTGSPDIFSIANLLGHSDIRSAMVYLHTDSTYMDYLREQLD